MEKKEKKIFGNEKKYNLILDMVVRYKNFFFFCISSSISFLFRFVAVVKTLFSFALIKEIITTDWADANWTQKRKK